MPTRSPAQRPTKRPHRPPGTAEAAACLSSPAESSSRLHSEVEVGVDAVEGHFKQNEYDVYRNQRQPHRAAASFTDADRTTAGVISVVAVDQHHHPGDNDHLGE